MKSLATTEVTMTCTACDVRCNRIGVHRNGLRRFRCPQCRKTYTEPHKRLLDGMNLNDGKALLALQLMVEGNSLRSIQRTTDIDINTIMKLVILAGAKCEKLMARLIVSVPVKDVQCDEIWSFVRVKEGHITPAHDRTEGIGDQYCYVAMERHSKLVLNFALGRRDQATTDAFIEGLRHATSPDSHFQITTDGFQPYISAITTTLSDRCDYAQHIKTYGAPVGEEHRYSPAEVISSEKVPVMGNPDRKRICTSHIERQNLTIRMSMRRLTRLTNGFSKKWENLWAAYCLHFAYYNFCRIHKTLRVTPCMEAGITTHVWDMKELFD